MSLDQNFYAAVQITVSRNSLSLSAGRCPRFPGAPSPVPVAAALLGQRRPRGARAVGVARRHRQEEVQERRQEGAGGRQGEVRVGTVRD